MSSRLGFLGVGWIGRDRLELLAASGVAEVAAVADTDAALAEAVAASCGVKAVAPEQLLAGTHGLDGVVIATPSALHAAQAVAALEAGMAVFCQKPLGRSAGECEEVVRAARAAGRPLGVDLSYRHLAGATAMRQLVASGALGTVFAADLTFHNAYGPDKAWYTDRARSGGGCVIDLGIHLVDLALWMLDEPAVADVSARLFAGGRPLEPGEEAVEDYAVARLDLESGGVVRIACSWFLHAGCDAVIAASFSGTEGAVAMHNVGGSFYDFAAAHHTGTASRVIAAPPDAWSGRAIVEWATLLGSGAGFAEQDAARLVAVARVVDRVHGR